MKLIAEIEDVFDISRRGCVIVPGVPHDFEPSVNINSIIEIYIGAKVYLVENEAKT